MFPFRRRDRVRPGEAHERVTSGAAVLVDVREPAEWRAGHAPGAVHVPLSRLAAGTTLPSPARGKDVIVVCRSGARSRRAVKLLSGQGVTAVDITGGMSAWARAGLPVRDRSGRPGVIA